MRNKTYETMMIDNDLNNFIEQYTYEINCQIEETNRLKQRMQGQINKDHYIWQLYQIIELISGSQQNLINIKNTHLPTLRRNISLIDSHVRLHSHTACLRQLGLISEEGLRDLEELCPRFDIFFVTKSLLVENHINEVRILITELETYERFRERERINFRARMERNREERTVARFEFRQALEEDRLAREQASLQREQAAREREEAALQREQARLERENLWGPESD